LGLIFLICKFNKKFYLKIYCEECIVNQVQLFLVRDFSKIIFLIDAQKENFLKRYKFMKNEIPLTQLNMNLNKSKYLGEEVFNEKKEEQIILYFKNNKYIYLNSINNFTAVQFDLRKFTYNEINDFFSNGIKNIFEYNYLLNKFGENVIKIKNNSLNRIIFKKFFSPLIIYTIFIMFIWIRAEYFSFSIVVASLSFILLMMSSHQKYLNYKRIFDKINFYEVPKIERVIFL